MLNHVERADHVKRVCFIIVGIQWTFDDVDAFRPACRNGVDAEFCSMNSPSTTGGELQEMTGATAHVDHSARLAIGLEAVEQFVELLDRYGGKFTVGGVGPIVVRKFIRRGFDAGEDQRAA